MSAKNGTGKNTKTPGPSEAPEAPAPHTTASLLNVVSSVNAENTTKAGSAKKLPKNAWKKGQSGNPKGRPKIPVELRDAFRELTPKALKTLKQIVDKGDRDSDRVKAAEIILDRAWGKAASAQEDRDAVKDRFSGLSAEVLLLALGVDPDPHGTLILAPAVNDSPPDKE